MKALVLGDDRSLTFTDRPAPVCEAPEDVVVRVRQTGICGTDRGVLLGKFPAEAGVIMGHEAVGTVSAVGAGVHELEVGDRVIVNPTLYCGHCERCRLGELNFCLNKTGNEIGIDRDGAFAEFIRIESQFLHRIPDDMDFDRAVVVEPLACVLNNLEAAKPRPGDSVIVLGGGPIGVVTAMLAVHLGCPVVLVEPDQLRRETAADILSYANEAAGMVSTVASVDQRTARVVVDTVGSLLETACESAEVGGTVVIMGFDDRAEAKVRPLRILQRGITIVGAGDYNSLIFPRAIEIARQLPLERVITHRFFLHEYAAALEAVGVSGTSGYGGLKVVIKSDTEA